MKTNIFTNKFTSCFGIASLALAFTACGDDNPIEIVNGYGDMEIDEADLNSLSQGLSNIDLYKCTQKYSKERCVAFFNKYGSYDCKEIADFTNYRDDGSKVEQAPIYVPVPVPAEDSAKKFLKVNKYLNLTITKYEQTAESISDTKEVGDPEVKFIVKTYSDDELVNSPATALVLDTTNVKKWSGTNSTIVFLPRGIDKIEICPIVIDENKLGDDILSDGKCITIKDIGFLEDRVTTKQTEKGKKFSVDWSWDIYTPEN